jgi:hypothetical protein
MKKKRTIAVVAFLLMLLLWAATIAHDTLGFVTPRSAEAVGFDLWTTAMWFGFLYSIWNLWRAFTASGKVHVNGRNK